MGTMATSTVGICKMGPFAAFNCSSLMGTSPAAKSPTPWEIIDALHCSSAQIADLHVGAELVKFFGPVGVPWGWKIRPTAYQRDSVLAVRRKAEPNRQQN